MKNQEKMIFDDLLKGKELSNFQCLAINHLYSLFKDESCKLLKASNQTISKLSN